MFYLRSMTLLRSSYFLHQPARVNPILVIPLSKSKKVFPENRRSVNGLSGPSPGQIERQTDEAEEAQGSKESPPNLKWGPTVFKMFESAATTFASILVLA